MELTLPTLTQTMGSAKVVEWLRLEGQPVRKGEALLIVETDKAAVEVQSPVTGRLERVAAKVGDIVPVGDLLCVIHEEGQEPVRTQVQAQVPEERVREERKERAAAVDENVRVSPLARKLAREHGVDLSLVRGTGPGGRIVREDVLGALQVPSAPARPAAAASSAPMTGMRRAIAQQMALSARTAARVTLFMEVDMSAAVALREQASPRFQSQYQARLTYTHLIVGAVARALREHPQMNTRWKGEDFETVSEINIGVAVALPDGLVVPVLRQADGLSLLDIARAEARLAEKARSGALSADEFSGGTFTVTNLGMYGVDAFTPIINPPEAAILGVGRLAEKPVVRRGQVVPCWMIELCLSFDHRIVDGAPAAAFLARVRDLLEDPGSLSLD